MTTITKPEGLEQKHLEYLDQLPEVSIVTAVFYLGTRFDLDRHVARKYVDYWVEMWVERQE